MKGPRLTFLIGPVAIALIFINCGCTAQMRKARHWERAERYFKAGQYDEAKIEYVKALRADPRDARIYARMGQMWLEEDAPLRAGGFLGQALKYDEKDWASRLRLARAYALIGQPGPAHSEAEKVLKQVPDSGEALLLLLETSRNQDEYNAAQEQVSRFPQRQNPYFYLATATLALQKADLAAAETAVKDAVAADPKSPQAHVAVGRLFLAKKDSARAGEEFKTAANLAPIRSRERLNYAQFKMQSGAAEEAKAYLQNITTQARDFVGAWTLLAKIALSEKKYDEALGLLDNVFNRDPDEVDARSLSAQIYLAKKDFKKATDILDRLDKALPNSPAIKYELAIAYLRAGNTTQASSELEQALAINPNYPEALLLMAELNIRSGKPQAAIDPLLSLTKGRSDLVRAQTLLADAYQSAGRPDDAVAIIRDQIKAAPQNPRLYLLLGIVLRGQKKVDEARQAFEKALELDKKSVPAIEALIGLDVTNKAYGAAHQRVDALIQQNPQLALAYYLRGTIEVAEGKLGEAETSLNKAIELDPNLAPPFNLLVGIYVSTNKLDQAIRELDTMKARNPKDVRPLAISGLIHEKQNDFTKARDDYEKVLAINPNAIIPLNNLAYIYSEKLNNVGRAVELARKAHDLVPAEPTISDTFGWTLYKQGDYQQAVPLLQDAAAKLPDNAEVQFHLGMAQYMMGNRDAARTSLEKATAAPGEFVWKNEAKTRLALLSNRTDAGANLSAADLEKIANDKSNDPIALMRLGDAYEKQGAPDKAADAYQRATQANPRLLEAVVKLAQINAGPLKNSAKALEYAKKARDIAGTDPHVMATVGQIAYQAGNFSWAYSLLQDSSRQLPDDGKVARDFAWAAYSLGKIGEAQEAMQRAANTAGPGKEQQDAQRFLAMIKLDANEADPSSSENDVNAVLSSDPNYVPALMARGDIQSNRDAKAAEAIYNQVLQRYPDFAPAQKRLAVLYADDPPNAEKGYALATKARRTLSDDPTLTIALGKLSFHRNDYTRAVQLLQGADRNTLLNGKSALDGKALFYLGMAQINLGRKGEGKETLTRALGTGISDSMAQEAKQKIAEFQNTSNKP